MPPRRRVVHTHAASASREGGDENVPQPVPPVDQDALRQMVQDAARQAAQEAVQQAVREAARVAAQEMVRQMVAAQKGQHVPPVQFQGHQQPLFSRFRQFRFRGINSPVCSRFHQFRFWGRSSFLFRRLQGFSGSTTTTTCPLIAGS